MFCRLVHDVRNVFLWTSVGLGEQKVGQLLYNNSSERYSDFSMQTIGKRKLPL